MTAEQNDDGEWFVVNDAGEQIAGPFATEDEAKEWIRQRRGLRLKP